MKCIIYIKNIVYQQTPLNGFCTNIYRNMKLVSFQNSDAHHKNKDAFIRMCLDLGHTYIEVNKYEDIPSDADIVWSNSKVIAPHQVSENTKLVLGPGFFTHPYPAHPLFYFDYRGKGVYNCLSPWVKTLFEEFIKGPRIDLFPLPFPVDVEKFKPKDVPKTLDCLVYYKHRKPSLLQNVMEEITRNQQLSCQLFHYSNYKENDYIQALQKAKFAVWIGCGESQGFALQECLSMNVPIVVLDVDSQFDETSHTGEGLYDHLLGKVTLKATTIPYWDDRCGLVTKNPEDLRSNIELMAKNWMNYKPRMFVLETLTSEVCFNRWRTALKI